MEVPCGQCLGCRLDYRRMWAMRITHEASLWEYLGGNSFITLTYRNKAECDEAELKNGKHVPDDFSLNKADFQRFMKRLRKKFNDRKIKVFYCGEYGRKCKHGIDVDRVGCPLCNTGRPHFHACLFNLSFDDLEAYQSDGGVMRYTSPTLEKIWGYGFVDVGELNFASASYVAGYVLKKVKGIKQPDHYMTVDLNGEITWIEPEFIGMSRGNATKKGQRCGIGAEWYAQFKDDVYPSDEVPVPGVGVMNGVPRYYDDILRAENPEMYEAVKARRKAFMLEHAEEYTHERLLSKYKCAKAKVKLRERRTVQIDYSGIYA